MKSHKRFLNPPFLFMNTPGFTVRKDFRSSGKQERDVQSKIIEVFDSHLSDRFLDNQKLMLIGEEVAIGLENSNDRKIDLLAIDQSGQPVIIELKLAKDENQALQAFRYGLLLQELSVMDMERIFLGFKKKLYPIEIPPEKPTTESIRKELNDFTNGAIFEESKKKFSIILIAEEFDDEVLYACKKLSDLKICIAHCIKFSHPSERELVFEGVSWIEKQKKTATSRPKKTKSSSSPALSSNEILNKIDDSELREAFAKLVQKYEWQPHNERLVIKRPEKSRERQIKWRFSISGNSLHFRQNNIINGAAVDMDQLRLIGLIDVDCSEDKKHINAKINSAETLNNFINLHDL